MERAIVCLVALYIAGICGIGYGLRQINEAQAANGAPVKRIMISGGAGQQDLVCQLLADTTGKPVVATASEEPVLLGSAILAGLAGGVFPDMTLAMTTMSSSTAAFGPASGRLAEHHAARFNAFQRLQNVAREVQKVA
jgi:D-ribulokinase